MICETIMICDNETKSIVETASEYTLKYDEETEGLRDKTVPELVKEYGPKIRCPCMDRTYQVNSQSIKNHFGCQKHKNWVIKSQKEHIETYGHCCSPQDIVNIQSKELRNLKRHIHDLTNKIKTLTHENTKLEKLNKSSQDEIKTLTHENTKLEKLNKSSQDEIETLKSKITQYEDEYEKFTDCD